MPPSDGSDLVVQLRRALTLNLALCDLKLGDWAACEQLCSACLAENPGEVKALYRRAFCRNEGGARGARAESRKPKSFNRVLRVF